MGKVRETGYEKIDHAVFRGDMQVSKVYGCKADAEIEMGLMKRNSIYKSNLFSVRPVNKES